MSVPAAALLDELSHAVEKQRMRLEAGKSVELGGLDGKAIELSRQLQRMEEGTLKEQHMTRMAQLVIALREIQAELQKRAGALQAELQGLGNAQRANIAYRTAEASDNFRKEKTEGEG